VELFVALAGAAIGATALLLQSKPLPSADDLKKAQAKLATNPDDPDANKVVGKYLAFVTGDYTAAMPYLSKSGDKVLKPVADHELDPTYTDTPLKKIGMGDDWTIAARSYPQIARILYDRSAFWYAQSWPFVDGVWKDKLREQMRKLFQNAGVPDPKGLSAAPSGWKNIDTAQKAGPTTKAAHSGRVSFQVVGSKKIPDQVVSLEQALTAIPGKTYEFSAWVMSDGTDSTNDVISAVFFGPNANMMGVSILLIPQDQPWWHKVEGSFLMPAGAAILQIHVGVASRVGSLFIDDISLRVDQKEMLQNGSFENR
jgi:hypothetical protein